MCATEKAKHDRKMCRIIICLTFIKFKYFVQKLVLRNAPQIEYEVLLISSFLIFMLNVLLSIVTIVERRSQSQTASNDQCTLAPLSRNTCWSVPRWSIHCLKLTEFAALTAVSVVINGVQWNRILFGKGTRKPSGFTAYTPRRVDFIHIHNM